MKKKINEHIADIAKLWENMLLIIITYMLLIFLNSNPKIG